MKIIETNLNFDPLRRRRSTAQIIIHHTASSDRPASTFHAEHIRREWGGIGYHYLIRKNGDIERGRPLATVGVHTRQLNNTSIGIALTGNFENHPPDDRQVASLATLTKFLLRTYPKSSVLLHREVAQTKCPGKFFPLNRLVWRTKSSLGG